MADASASVIINTSVNGLHFIQKFVDLVAQINKTSVAGFNKIEAAAKQTTSAIEQTGTRLQNLQQGLNSVTSVLTRVAVGLGAITGLLLGTSVSVIDAASSFDMLYRSLIFVSGGAEAAKKKLKELEQVARLPGLGFREAIQGQVQLQSTLKITDATATKALKAFGQGVAVGGGGKEQLGLVLTQLGQIASKGKAAGEDIRAIKSNVPSMGAALEKAFGSADLEKINKLGLNPEEFVSRVSDALIELNKNATNLDGFANGMENMTDSLDRFKIAIGTPILKELGKALAFIGDSVEYLTQAWNGLNPETQKTILYMIGLTIAFLAALTAIAAIAATISGAIAGFVGLVAVVGSTGGAIAILLAPLALLLALLPVVVVGIVGLGAAIAALYIVYQRNADAINAKIASVTKYVQDSFNKIKFAIEYAYRVTLPSLLAAVRSIVGAIERFWENHGAVISFYVKTAWDFIIKVILRAVLVIAQAIQFVANIISGNWAGAWLNAQTLFYLFVDALFKGIVLIHKAIIYMIFMAVKLIIGANILFIKAAASLAGAFVKGFVEYMTTKGSLSMLGAVTGIAGYIGKSIGGWFSAGKKNAEAYNQGFTNSIPDFQKELDEANAKLLEQQKEDARLAEEQRLAQEKLVKDGLARMKAAQAGDPDKVKEPNDAADRAMAKPNRDETLRRMSNETKVLQLAYTRRTVAAITYYEKVASLARQGFDVQIEEQQAIIERANRLKDQGDLKQRDQKRAEILEAQSRIAELEDEKAQALTKANEDYLDFTKQLVNEYNQQLERILEITGEFEQLGSVAVGNKFDEKIREITVELSGTVAKLQEVIDNNGDQKLIDFLTDRKATIQAFLDNLKFEKDVSLIYERQKAIEITIADLDAIRSSGSFSEAEKSIKVTDGLTNALQRLLGVRQELINKGARTADVDAKIAATQKSLYDQKLIDFDRERNALLDERERLLTDIEIKAKAAGEDERTVQDKINVVYKQTADLLAGTVIPQMEAYLLTLTTGSANAETLRKQIVELKKQIALDQTPDKRTSADRAIADVKKQFDNQKAIRDRRLAEIGRDQELSGFERDAKRKAVLEEQNAILGQILSKWLGIINAQSTGMNPEQIAAFTDEWNTYNEALADSNSQIQDMSKTLKGVAKDALAGGLITFFDDLVAGTKSLKDAALDFANSFIRAIQQVIVQMLVLKTLTMLFNLMSPGLGSSLFGGAAGGSVAGHAAGGDVGGAQTNPVGKISGAGSGTSDSILAFFGSVGRFAKVSNGEYIFDAQTVNNVGTDVLDKIRYSRGRALAPLLRRAVGGSVDAAVASRASALNTNFVSNETKEVGDTNLSVNLSLSPVEFAKRAFNHPDGVMALVDAIGNNATKIKTRLQIS